MRIVSYLLTMLVSVSAFAAEPEQATGYRSKMENRFWIGADAGLVGLSGLGDWTGLRTRFNFGRCGAVAGWHHQRIHYYDPADVRNTIFGLGVECIALKIGYKNRFFRGTQLRPFIIAQYGKSRYLVWEYPSNSTQHIDRAGGSTNGAGWSTGTEFLFPLWFGFWSHARAGLEYMNFTYKVPDQIGGHDFPGISKLNIFLQVGVDFSF